MSYVRPGVWGNEWLRFKSQGLDYWMPRSPAPGALLPAVTDAFVIIPPMYGTLATDSSNQQLITVTLGGVRHSDGFVRCHGRFTLNSWSTANLASTQLLQAVPEGFRPLEDGLFVVPLGVSSQYSLWIDILRGGQMNIYRPAGTVTTQQTGNRVLEWLA